MAKARRKAESSAKKRPDENDLQYRARLARDRDAAQSARAPIVNEFAAQHGDYQRTGSVMLNRGGSAIDRWKNGRVFEQGELLAVEYCQDQWNRIDGKGTSDTRVDCGTGDGMTQHLALDEMHRLKKGIPAKYWDCFENICRHHIRAEIAGIGLANSKRSAQDAARLATVFVAGMVAERKGY